MKEYFTQAIVLPSDDLLDRFIKQSVLKCVAQTVKTEMIRELVNVKVYLLFSDARILQNDVQSCRSDIIHVVHVLNFELFTKQSYDLRQYTVHKEFFYGTFASCTESLSPHPL